MTAKRLKNEKKNEKSCNKTTCASMKIVLTYACPRKNTILGMPE